MNHQKEDVLPKAEPIWVEILSALTSIDTSIFNPKKEHPCPCCGGKTRFRYRNKPAGLDRPFYCNHCGSKNGIELLMELTGFDFNDSINTVGDYLGCIPTEQIQIKQREFEIQSSFPGWYPFDMKHYLKLKQESKVDLSMWQRISGLNMLDILKHGDDALIPLLDKNGKPVDFMMIDGNGNMQTTGGSQIVPSEFHSVFGDKIGKRRYIAVSPFTAAHASIFTQRQVVCCYELENLWDVAKNLEEPPVVIVTSIEETQEADQLKFEQLTFNKKNNTVSRRLWKPYEIMESKRND
ncbi:DNA primase/helicase [Vibrio phage 1.273.O._10N.286.54.C7]|nr:DNA primase/helicase [Vibrio phage 1.273.O._10N.286.54.C7]